MTDEKKEAAPMPGAASWECPKCHRINTVQHTLDLIDAATAWQERALRAEATLLRARESLADLSLDVTDIDAALAGSGPSSGETKTTNDAHVLRAALVDIVNLSITHEHARKLAVDALQQRDSSPFTRPAEEKKL